MLFNAVACVERLFAEATSASIIASSTVVRCCVLVKVSASSVRMLAMVAREVAARAYWPTVFM